MTELKTLRWGDNTGLSGGLHILVREVEEDFTIGGDLKTSARRDFKMPLLALKVEEEATPKELPLSMSSRSEYSARHGKERRQILPWTPWEGGPRNTLISTQRDPLPTFDHQNCKLINMYCFKLPHTVICYSSQRKLIH